MPRPLLYEINTRCWLGELSRRSGRPVRLDGVPEAEFAFWKRMGFTHLWLMGAWTTGEQSRRTFLDGPDVHRRLHEALPDWSETDVAGSPYAITAYEVPEALGGDRGLRMFRERLNARGIGLVLDFVPNHVGLDHPWAFNQAQKFVQSPDHAAETFHTTTRSGPRWIAHGKDPWFPAWRDTLQLDYRRQETRAAMSEQLRSVAARCEGVRCDMAMLLLNEVFARTWEKFPCTEAAIEDEFWAGAIASVKRTGFLFIAEAYWDLEARLQSLGFDFTYNKRVMDFIVERRWPDLQRHLLERGDDFAHRSVHFLENHDEPRIAGRLPNHEHRAAAAIALTLPGMCLLHEGQLTGAKAQVPVQLLRRPEEKADVEITSFYETLLTRLPDSLVGRSRGRLLRPVAAPKEDEAVNVVTVLWKDSTGEGFDLVMTNHSPEAAVFDLPELDLGPAHWRVSDRLNGHRSKGPAPGEDRSFHVPACGVQWLHFEPA